MSEFDVVFKMMKEQHNAEVATLRAQISELWDDRARLLADDEEVFCSSWSRDCDNCEGSASHRFDNEKEFQLFREDFYEGAEGPCSVERITKEQYDEFEASFRDRNMEAFENGRGTSTLI